jgi:hypothetical protein
MRTPRRWQACGPTAPAPRQLAAQRRRVRCGRRSREVPVQAAAEEHVAGAARRSQAVDQSRAADRSLAAGHSLEQRSQAGGRSLAVVRSLVVAQSQAAAQAAWRSERPAAAAALEAAGRQQAAAAGLAAAAAAEAARPAGGCRRTPNPRLSPTRELTAQQQHRPRPPLVAAQVAGRWRRRRHPRRPRRCPPRTHPQARRRRPHRPKRIRATRAAPQRRAILMALWRCVSHDAGMHSMALALQLKPPAHSTRSLAARTRPWPPGPQLHSRFSRYGMPGGGAPLGLKTAS